MPTTGIVYSVNVSAKGQFCRRPFRVLFLKPAINFSEKSLEVDRLGIVVIAAGVNRLFLITRHGMRGQRNHWNLFCGVVALNSPLTKSRLTDSMMTLGFDRG